MMETGFRIGQLARHAEVSVEAIRYYQRRGLVALPARPGTGARLYLQDALQSLRFIKRAQSLGFTLEEIGQLMKLAPATACATTQEIALAKLRLIDKKVATLHAMRSTIESLLQRCRADDGGNCAIISALSDEDVNMSHVS